MNLGKDQFEFDIGWQKQAQRIDAAEKSGEISKEFIAREYRLDIKSIHP